MELDPPSMNGIVEALPFEEQARLRRYGEDVPILANEVLCEPHEMQQHMYFPHSGFITLLTVMPDGVVAEAGFLGADGALGTGYSATDNLSFTRALVCVSGSALRLPIIYFQNFMDQSTAFRNLVGANNARLAKRSQQIAGCNLLHRLDARLCRWMLQVLDNSRDATVIVMQENLAQMLGVNRSRLNEALRKLHADNAIVQTRRGALQVTDRTVLADRACGCYRRLRDLDLSGPKSGVA